MARTIAGTGARTLAEPPLELVNGGPFTLFCFDRYKISIRCQELDLCVIGAQGRRRIGQLPRPREFDDDEVLDAAIACFWQRGLEATSVRDLAAEMGINGPSLYNAFGDKHSLFARALERYAERSMRSTIRQLEGGLSPKEAIREFLHLLIKRSITDPDRRGCLIVNSALEVSPHDPDLGEVIASYLDEIEAFFRRCLERGQKNGEINTSIDSRDSARHLLGIVLGIRVAARYRPERALLEGMVRPALSLLDRPTKRRPRR